MPRRFRCSHALSAAWRWPRAAWVLTLALGAISACSHTSHATGAPVATDPPAATSTAPGGLHQIRASPVAIPVHTEEGDLLLQGAVFWSEQPTPPSGRPVVVFSHGSPMTVAERQIMTPFGYLNAIKWFTDRGYVVVAALRHGFGKSGGHFSEGVSAGDPDYTRAGHIAAHDVHAVLDFLKTVPGLDLDHVVLAGHSAGGFASLALLGETGVRVRAALNFAGGKGAQLLPEGPPYTDAIVAAAAEYGHTARIPSLWIYAANDHWFAPALVTRMFEAYTAAGGPAEIERVPAVGSDGHALFTADAQQLWTSSVDRFLARQGLPAGRIQ
jgi:dienelactone hydrolase